MNKPHLPLLVVAAATRQVARDFGTVNGVAEACLVHISDWRHLVGLQEQVVWVVGTIPSSVAEMVHHAVISRGMRVKYADRCERVHELTLQYGAHSK